MYKVPSDAPLRMTANPGPCSIIVFNGVRFIDDLMANRLLDTLSMEARSLLLFA